MEEGRVHCWSIGVKLTRGTIYEMYMTIVHGSTKGVSLINVHYNKLLCMPCLIFNDHIQKEKHKGADAKLAKKNENLLSQILFFYQEKEWSGA